MDALHSPEQHNELGNSLKRAGNVAEAIGHYREALRLRPRWADAHNNLGLALRALGDMPAALEQFRLAVRARADHVEARNNLGVTLSDLGQLAEATATYQLVLKHRPGAADTHNNLGVVLVQRGKRPDAIVHYRRALEIRPNYAEAHNNLGNALRHEGKFEHAEACLREALRLRPEYAEAHNNLAIILMKQERVDEAIAHYRQALRLKTDYPDAHKNLGLALLGKGDYAAGWKEYEYRWGTKEMPARKFDRPAWDGGPLDGKTILLYSEQGLGDTVQFIRFAAVAAERGGKVIVECPKALLGIFGRCRGIERLVAQGERLPAFDVHAPLMSVPGIVGMELAAIPSGNYLSADPERIRKWGEELKGLTGYKIGIAWQGSRGFQDDHFRSISLKHFEPLAKLAGARLISLQKGHGSEQLRQLGGWNVLDLGNRLDDFLDTAAVMKHLDLVISVDTAVAHLAGAVGVPVWVALSTAPDWRWLHERTDSPWYPTARLFRQQKCGDWAGVLQRTANELESRPPLESAERYAQRGLAQLKEGKAAEAAGVLQRAVELDPQNAILHNNLGVAFDQLRKSDEALASFEAAAALLKPDYADALHNLGNRLRRMNRMAEAEVVYRKALKVTPDSADLCNHLGITLLAQAKHGEAEACFQRALRLNPNHAESHNNLGVLREQLRRTDEAIAYYLESLRLKPETADTHKNLALAWLLRGDYLRGWREYEWRWKSPAAQARNFTQPRYDGRVLDGETVLLFAEQGLGDTIQFARYAPLVKERGGVTLLECPGELVRLFARCPGIDRVIASGTPLPEFAFQLPLMSAPAAFCSTVDTVPARVPYLSAEPGLIEKWGKELVGHGQAGSPPDGVRIGIAWQGSQKYAGDAHRSAPLRAFAPLASIPGVQLVSLQKGHGSEQLREVGAWNVHDMGNRLGDFADTAALMTHLDVVVCVDTSVAHLAGALGVPVWVALSTAADWRWLERREDSFWYPTARLFRQGQWGDWAGVFQRIAAALRAENFTRLTPRGPEVSSGDFFDRLARSEIDRARVGDEHALGGAATKLGGLLAARARSVTAAPELLRLVERLSPSNEASTCGFDSSEDDGIRTRNFRIDSPVL